MNEKIAINVADIEASAVQFPGVTAGQLSIQLLNADASRGMIASVIVMAAGAVVPAHRHEKGAEAHFVLEGEFVDSGRTFGPGAYLTHAAGVVHGPHSSPRGCRVLTMRDAEITVEDHHLADVGDETSEDHPMVSREDASASDVPASEKSAATPDNPTNPATG